MCFCGSISYTFWHGVRFRIVREHTRCKSEQVRFVRHAQIPHLATTSLLNADHFARVLLIPMPRLGFSDLTAEDWYFLVTVSGRRKFEHQAIPESSANGAEIDLKVVVPGETEPPAIVRLIVMTISVQIPVEQGIQEGV